MVCTACASPDIYAICSSCRGYELCAPCHAEGIHSPLGHGWDYVASDESSNQEEEGKAEIAPPAPPAVHPTAACDGCEAYPLRGVRYRCQICDDYDLCGTCYQAGVHSKLHPFASRPSPDVPYIILPARAAAAPAAEAFHPLVTCDGCLMHPLRGDCYRCTVCGDYDLCASCYDGGVHPSRHAFSVRSRPTDEYVRLPPRSEAKEADAARIAADGAGGGRACEGCGLALSRGPLYSCLACPDYYLCPACYKAGVHLSAHAFRVIEGGVISCLPPRDAADRAAAPSAPHPGVRCDGCLQMPIRGRRFKCATCRDYDLCQSCHDSGVHTDRHGFYLYDRPGSSRVPAAPRPAARR